MTISVQDRPGKLLGESPVVDVLDNATAAVFFSIKHLPKYAGAADIAQCFDRIGHLYLLNKLAIYRAYDNASKVEVWQCE